jgi:hypothetical protein
MANRLDSDPVGHAFFVHLKAMHLSQLGPVDGIRTGIFRKQWVEALAGEEDVGDF